MLLADLPSAKPPTPKPPLGFDAEKADRDRRAKAAALLLLWQRFQPKPIDDDARILEEANDLLDDELFATRLTKPFEAGELTDEQRARLLFRVVVSGRQDLATLGGPLAAGRETLQRFGRRMADGIPPLHYAAALATLSARRPTPADLEEMRQRANDQLAFLGAFIGSIATGAQALDPTLGYRAGRYSTAAWGTGQNVRRRRMIRDGYPEAMRLLGDAQHCDSCVEYHSWGWVPIEDMPPIGDSECGGSCVCEIIYR